MSSSFINPSDQARGAAAKQIVAMTPTATAVIATVQTLKPELATRPPGPRAAGRSTSSSPGTGSPRCAVLTAKQVAERLGVSPALVNALAKESRIRHLRVGRQGRRGKLLFAERDVTAFLEDCTVEPPDDPGEAAYRRHLNN